MIQTKKEVSLLHDSKSQTGTCTYVEYGNWDGVKAGLRVLFLVWIATIPTILIPIVHFVSIPLGFFCGPVFGLVMFVNRKKKRTLLDGKAICPNCKNELNFSFEDAQHAMNGICPTCHSGYRAKIIR